MGHRIINGTRDSQVLWAVIVILHMHLCNSIYTFVTSYKFDRVIKIFYKKLTSKGIIFFVSEGIVKEVLYFRATHFV